MKRHFVQRISHGQRGMTLVEIMVSVTIALVLTAGAIQIFGTSKKAYRVSEALSRIQESGRFAMYLLAKDIRMIGFKGCGNNNTTIANTMNNNADDPFLDITKPLTGYEEGATLPSEFASAYLQGDAIVISHGSGNDHLTVTSHNPTSATIHLSDTHSLKTGDIVIICDPTHTAIFQMSGPTNSNNNATTAVHNTGNEWPGNCTKGLGAPVQCTTNGTEYIFDDTAKLLRYHSVAYFVGTGTNGEPALFRHNLATGNNEELVAGVEDMQILYGEDRNGDDVPEYYVNANNINDMLNVVSVQVTLTVRSLEDNITETVSAQNDKRLRHTFANAVTIRNRVR